MHLADKIKPHKQTIASGVCSVNYDIRTNLVGIFTIFRLLAPFAILAGCIMALPMYACYVLTLDVQARDVRFGQSEDSLGACIDDLKEAKSAKYICKRRKR